MLPSVKKVLFLYAHPNSSGSRANRRIVDAVRALPNVTFHPLYSRYPEFWIDVKREQHLLLDHQVIVFQHPIYWYSMPPLLKLWMDEVLEYNFAYGPEGKALSGKQFLLSVTLGGAEGSYREGGQHGFPLEKFLFPYRQMARLCALEWEEPQTLFHALQVGDDYLDRYAESVAARIAAISRPGHAGERE